MNNTDVMEAIDAIAKGEIIILVDNEDRENEGDFVQASECATPDSVNFMITYGRGLLCQCITSSRARVLSLKMQVSNNTSLHNTAFTVSVDAIQGTTTGISTSDRWKTIQCLVAEDSKPEDLGRPGHIFPIVAHDGGILARDGHTEGSIELARLAGKKPNTIICEILNEDGSMSRRDDLQQLSKKFGIKMISIEALIAYIKEQPAK